MLLSPTRSFLSVCFQLKKNVTIISLESFQENPQRNIHEIAFLHCSTLQLEIMCNIHAQRYI